jgi:hypothetical protein
MTLRRVKRRIESIVARQVSVFEDGVTEEVRRDHRDGEPRLVHGGAEGGDSPLSLVLVAAERDEVIVMERHAPSAERGEAVHGVRRVQRGAGGVAERIGGPPPDCPEAEREAVLGGGGQLDARELIGGRGHGYFPKPAVSPLRSCRRPTR